MITPLAHAQMNIVASTGFGLMALVYFVLPKISGKPWMSQPLIRASLVLSTVGILMYYVSLLTLGFIESVHVHQLTGGAHPLDLLTAFTQARLAMGWTHPFWLTVSNAVLALGYIAYAVNILGTLGPANVRDALADWVLQLAALMDRSMKVRRRQMATTRFALRMGALRAFAIEYFAICFGFLGAGWINSGRSAFGLSLFFTWFTTWLVYVEWNLSAQAQLYGPDFSFIRPVLPLYFGLPLVSATCAAVTYLRRGLKRPGLAPRPGKIIESNALLIEDAPVAD